MCVLAVWSAAPTAAQVVGGPRPRATSERRLGFLTRYDFDIAAAQLAGDGESQFKWDTDIAADMDIFDFDVLRGGVFINVETMVGDERRAIDPNQNNYTIDVSVFARLPRGEYGVTFHHLSRHRADRENPGSPSWNMLGFSYGDRVTIGATALDVGGRWLGTITRSEVDYEGEFSGYLRLIHPLTDRVSVIGEIDGTAVWVDERVFGRDTQYAGQAHGGVRIRGGVGALELLVGGERRIDADIFTRQPFRWTRFSFRFVVD